jgi:small subunit ribosomal protein S20
MQRTRIKSVVRAVETAVKSNDKEAAANSLKLAVKTIDSACLKGVIHKNNAARKVSRLTKKVNALEKAGAA